MKMTLRWYGSKFDTVTLKQIRQIPGVTGVITTLYDTVVGEVWSRERIREMKEEVEAGGLSIEGIESVNVHDSIKTGAPDRDRYIGNYIQTLENLGKEDIHLVCYNFMPVFDWTRTELARRREDGSTVLAYTQEAVDALNPEKMFDSISGDMNGTVMPGWEPERMEHVKELFAMYGDIDNEKLFENLKFFWEQIMPVCDRYNINMAIHPDDPAWSVFGLPSPNGRPKLEEGGILFTDRETVDKVEKMKVCTCLNPLHTSLAVFGCLLGYKKISDEMRDKELVKLVETIGYKEGLPVVTNPGILDPKEFIDTVLKVRMPNPFMPDTPQRIATDTSQKIAVRFGETIKAYLKSENLNVDDLKMIPLVLAGWLRYLMAVDDQGKQFELSPDPLLEVLTPRIAKLKLGDTEVEAILKPIMENDKIFGINLYETGLADKVCSYFKKLIAGPNAVRQTLKDAFGE